MFLVNFCITFHLSGLKWFVRYHHHISSCTKFSFGCHVLILYTYYTESCFSKNFVCP